MGELSGRRLAVAGLSLVGLVVAVYLTLFQTKVVETVWDPFSTGSAWTLQRSPLVRWLGFPDAALGVGAYGAELVLDLSAGQRGPSAPRRGRTLALGALAATMAAGGVVLVALQAMYAHWCTLCLVSASASLIIAAFVVPEARRMLVQGAGQTGLAGRGRAAEGAIAGRVRGTDREATGGNAWPESSSSPERRPA